MSASDAVFNQIDANQDGRVDLGEFRNFVGQNLGTAATSWEASSLGAGAGWSDAWGAGASGYELGAAGAYDASYALGGGLIGGGLVGGGLVGTGLVGTGLADASVVYGGAAYGGAAYGGSVYDSAVLGASQVQYAADAQGLYQDPNPHIIRRANPNGVQ
ncbi:unnamed protein product, partial [Rotaria sp. Silwood1]